MASSVQTTRTGGRGIRKAVMDALPIRPIKLSEIYSIGFHRQYEVIQSHEENGQLGLDRTRQVRGNARGLDRIIGVGNRYKFLGGNGIHVYSRPDFIHYLLFYLFHLDKFPK